MTDPQTDPGQERAAGQARSLAALSSVLILGILTFLIVMFTILNGTAFLNFGNFVNIAVDASVLLLLAVGMTFVIITAGIDLSVGSVLVLSSVVGGQVMVALSGTDAQVQNYQFPNQAIGIPAGIAASLLTGLVFGLVNGLLITKLKMQPFIVTLGTLGIGLGLAQILTGGINVRFVPTAIQTQIGTREIFGFLPVTVLISVIVAVIAGIVLAKTGFGRYTYAIGSNAEAARRVGIDVDRHLLKVYALSGLLAGLAGVLDLARFNTTSIGAHSTDNLASISAVVIGGTSLFGGLGTMIGSVVGTFIPAVLRNGFIIQGVQAFWQEVAVGVVLILAVFVDQRRRSAEERM